MKTDFRLVNDAALSGIESVLSRWLPGGKRQGREYLVRNPTRPDNHAGSFSINLDSGAWADFASDDKGGDLVALVAYLDGIKQGEAADRLADFLVLADAREPVQITAEKPELTTGKAVWHAVLPVPEDAPPPLPSHYKHGKPSMRWEYRNATGRLLCLIYRFDLEIGRKQFLPLTYCKCEGLTSWRWRGLPEPRPLYNLDGLTENASLPVVVCEGEKAADAAALLFPERVCTTMMNGAQSPHKTDWTPLAGRVVWLWPDNDNAGLACMAKVAKLARDAGAAVVKTISLSTFACTPDVTDGAPCLGAARPLPDRWDAADALSYGWTAGHVELLMKSTDFLQPVHEVQRTEATPTVPANDTDDKKPSHFYCNDEGVWHLGRNEQSGKQEKYRVCSKLEITATTSDAKDESWGRLLEFDDRRGTHHTWAMPMELLKGDGTEYRGMLLSMGLQIEPFLRARNLLTQYIQMAQVERHARCVDRTGWHEKVFVLPDRTIGDSDERVLFQSASATPGTFRQKGKLADWQTNVAALCAGNSRLVFCVSAAFAAPLLHVTGMESGGIHLKGDSSEGKTAALRVAASVWGGDEYLQQWRATDNGLEALAAQHSDCLLALNEIGAVDPKVVGEAAYMLANGKGKARANRTGALRDPASWRVLVLSSGEHTLAEHMARAGKKPMAGQEVRLLPVPADAGKGHGVFENLHNYANGAAFHKALTDAAGRYYGTASQPYIANLVQYHDKLAEWIKNAQRDFTHANIKEGAGGQVNRAALRFALIGAAGELATRFGITGWQPGEAMQASLTCYEAWLSQRGGTGNLEELNMLAQVRRFFEAHGEARFTDWSRPASNSENHAPRTIQRAGYRRHSIETVIDGRGNDIALTRTEYFVFAETFKQEVCAGFDYLVVCKLLARLGCLMTESKGYTRRERLPGGEGDARCFRITHKLFESGGDE